MVYGLGDLWEDVKDLGDEIWDLNVTLHQWWANLSGWLAVEGWNILKNSSSRKLSSQERELMAPFFGRQLLSNVRIHENAVLAAPAKKKAMAMGDDIYWEGRLRICHDKRGATQARLLAHELVHCRQAGRWYGALYLAATYGSEAVSPKNDFEAEADEYRDSIASELERRRAAICAGRTVGSGEGFLPGRRDPCGWGSLLYG